MSEIAAIIAAGQPTMSSLDVTDLTGKRHDHVMRDIRSMLLELYGEDDLPRFGGVYQGGNGESRPCFNLPKRESLILVSGYDVHLRARIIDRWQELEAQAAPAAPLALDDPAALRAALLGYTEKVIALEAAKSDLEHQVEEIAPKAAIYDKYLNAEGLMSLQDLGRVLHQRPNKFIDRLKGAYLFESGGVLTPMARFVDLGIFQVTSKIFGEKVRKQTMATAKAVPYFAKKLEAEQRKAAA